MKKLIIGLALVALLLVPAACAGEAQEESQEIVYDIGEGLTG
ncbi:unnamed protein product [marine sediment metagenome]|uniref:Uncharacterized protein n=1 Tax=marine sediment metagenome TaxID=412755 RepID=X1NKJ7_9ZZZZ